VAYDESLLRNVPLTSAGFDRRADLRAGEDLLTQALADPATRVLPVAHGFAPGHREALSAGLEWRSPAAGDEGESAVYLGQANGRAHLALLLPPSRAAESWLSLRTDGAWLNALDGEALATATALGNWHAAHRHCPRCGTQTTPANAGWTRRCPADASEHFPRTDPAVIMAVLDPDDRLLLARHPSWPAGRLSVLAGFVEPGESLAMAVAREVHEEVGVVCRDIRYLGDQPWPFPASLMLGFEARTDDPTLHVDGTEIAEAHWVTRAEYRHKIESGAWAGGGTSLSISRRLILRWLDGGAAAM